MCGYHGGELSPAGEWQMAKEQYTALDDADRRMVRELILRLGRRKTGLKRKVIYEEDC